jgi:hypothetical protein
MIKKARTRFKLFLEVKETLPDTDFQNQGKGTTQNGTSEARNRAFYVLRYASSYNCKSGRPSCGYE